jgi:hypothetical protein
MLSVLDPRDEARKVNFLARPSMSTVFATFWTMFWTQVLLKCTVDDAMQVHIDEAALHRRRRNASAHR